MESVTHEADNASGAVILASGSYGGVAGPSGIYGEFARRLKASGITCVQLCYTQLHQVDPCVLDVLAAIESLASRGIKQVALVGWSFGAAVVVNAAVESPLVVGVAMIAGHRKRSEAVAQLSPRRLLLLHCTADKVMSVEHAQVLYKMASEPKELMLFDGGDHDFSKLAQELTDKLFEWCRELLPDREE